MESAVRAKVKEVTFPALHATLTEQNAQIDAANKKISEQDEKMEELEDLVTALALTLKDLQSAVSTPGGPSVATQRALSRTALANETQLQTLLKDGPQKDSDSEDVDSANAPLPPIYGVCFGYMYKMSSGKMSLGRSSALTSWKKRWFVIQDDGSVSYCKTMADSTSTTAEKTDLNLQGYSVESSPENGKPYCIKLFNSKQRTFFLSPDPETDENQKKWITAFELAIINQSKRTPQISPVQPYRYNSHSTQNTRTSMSKSSVSGVNVDEAVAALSRAAAVAMNKAHQTITEESPKEEQNTDQEQNQEGEVVVCEGWLERRNATGAWIRQYFKLQANELIAYEDAEATSEVSRKLVPGTLVDIVWEDDADGKERAFSVSDSNGTMTLCAESDDDMGTWVSELTNVAQSS
eukprot:m.13322 g.13322  ORF g.13322 m.13322 type:complete len:408 (-) comp9684_c0_seq1:31-1254(-)